MLFRQYLVTLFLLTSIPASLAQGSSQKCFDGLGCFHTSAHLTELPLDPDILGTQFHLYTRATRQHPVIINATLNESTWHSLLAGSHFNAHKDTKFITHGYMDSGETDWIIQLKDELLNKGDFNVIAVSWPKGSEQILNKAVANAFLVAAEVEKFITYLNRRHNTLDLAKIHLIGHSIGAQISGDVGSRLHGAIGRITGLDPAEPFYKDYSTSMRLDKTDAQFVDVIHSDGEPFNGVQGYGLFTASGHADFYPNGGVDQPGCSDDIIGGILGILGGHKEMSIACSHSRSHQFFIASINAGQSCKFTAHPCANWNDYKAGRCRSCPSQGCPVMGYEVSPSARGTFFLTTTMHSPFCGYEYYVEFDLTDNVDEDSYGRFFITLTGQHSSLEAEFSRDNVHYHARNTETQLVAVSHRVGTLTGVKVRFHHKNGLSGLGTDKTVYLHKVMVRDTTTQESFVFCTGDAQLLNDQPQTFTSHAGC